MSSLEQVIGEIETNLPNFTWLVRQCDAEPGYFANIVSKDFRSQFTIKDGEIASSHTGKTYPVHHTTAIKALEASYAMVLADYPYDDNVLDFKE